MCKFLSRPRSAEWSEANEAMASAAQVFEEVLDTFTTGKTGVLVRPSEDQDAVQAKAELERALAHLKSSETRWDVVLDDSEHPHPWIIVRDSGLPALANSTRIIGETLVSMGIGPRVLAAVYAFRWKEQEIYWIYQPRIRAFTPFAPATGGEPETRDHPLELRMEQASRKDIPTSRAIKEWYPIWGMPL